jgi:hypothetical protein
MAGNLQLLMTMDTTVVAATVVVAMDVQVEHLM